MGDLAASAVSFAHAARTTSNKRKFKFTGETKDGETCIRVECGEHLQTNGNVTDLACAEGKPDVPDRVREDFYWRIFLSHDCHALSNLLFQVSHKAVKLLRGPVLFAESIFSVTRFAHIRFD